MKISKKMSMEILKKTVIFMTIWIINLCALSAQIFESIYLLDGSVLEGYISEQQPGKGITFTAYKATITIPENIVLSINNHKVEYSSLPLEWKAWSDINIKDEKDMILSDIILDEKSDTLIAKGDSSIIKKKLLHTYLLNMPQNVKILEKGSVIKYLDLNPQTYYLKWSDVKYVKRPPRSKIELSGINYVIHLKNSDLEFSGEMLEQSLGKQIKLLKKDGVIEVIDINKIASIRKEKFNQEQSIFEQTPLLDQVYICSGRCITGIIINQNFVHKNEKNSFLTIQGINGEIDVVPYSEVCKYGNCINPDFNPLTDIILDKNSIMLNRKKVETTEFAQNEEGFIYAKDLKNSIILKKDSLEDGLFIIVEMGDCQKANKYALIGAVEKTEKIKKSTLKRLGFMYENYVTYSNPPTVQTISINGTCKMKFTVNNLGWYILYQTNENKGIIFKIE